MGFLTTVTIRNDYLWRFEADPKILGLEILDGMSKTSLSHMATNQLSSGTIVQPSFHADNHQIFLHWGNTVINVTAHNKDLERLYNEVSPAIAEEVVKVLNNMARDSRAYLRKLKEQKKLVGKAKNDEEC